MAQIFTPLQNNIWRKYFEKTARKPENVQVGHVYVFSYNSKGYREGTLKYYDQYPLSLCIAKYPDGWLGLSLHYLPPTTRLFFLKKIRLMNLRSIKNNGPVIVPYADIKDAANIFYREGMVIIRRYLTRCMVGRPAEILPSEWINIVSGEGAQWVNTTAAAVYADTKKQYQYLNKPKVNKVKKPNIPPNYMKEKVKRQKAYTQKNFKWKKK
jgi:hypothetical protein